MENAQGPSERVTVRSPFSGTIIERLATQGSYVDTGTPLYRIADLSHVWVQLDAYESDLPLLQTGQEVRLTVEALPGEVFEGRVTFVDPVLNQSTRTTRVRIEVHNPDGKLRPGMFAEARVESTSGMGEQPLVIPATAPLFTGRRSVVYVELPQTSRPTYEARVVKLGPQMGELYPVVGGLVEGDRVVIQGAFTLDADLQIRGGESMMTAPDDSDDNGPYDNIVQIGDEAKAQIASLIGSYLGIHEALAGDSLESAKEKAAAVVSAAENVDSHEGTPFHDAWMPIARQIDTHAGSIAQATTLDAARLSFRDLSQQIATVLRIFGNPMGKTLRLAFCPMALSNQGAEWVQGAEQIENPYFGASMHTCGEFHGSVEHGTYLPGSNMASEPAPTRAPAGGHQH
jgi:Cu(I)/Ag(I) efflux system membrane fusion protein